MSTQRDEILAALTAAEAMVEAAPKLPWNSDQLPHAILDAGTPVCGDGLIMTAIEFAPWPKIARLNRDIVVTEKIDGTNAAIHVLDDGTVAAQSRTRLITPEQDNHGFARWVDEHSWSLGNILGPGVHFGEWWGSGIQRGYGLTKGEKRFSLFNTHRWGDVATYTTLLHSVPVLYSGPFSQEAIDDCIDGLRSDGSVASPGFAKPEGVVIFHTAANLMFKVTLEKDEAPKSQAA